MSVRPRALTQARFPPIDGWHQLRREMSEAEDITTTCSRCGVFLSPESKALVLGKAYCTACAARPEVDSLRTFRDAHWGKRDGWAWFLGFTGLFALLGGRAMFATSIPLGSALILHGLGCLAFWSGVKVGRSALVTIVSLGALMSVVLGEVPNVLGIVTTVLAMRSGRTKLFFKLELSEEELASALRAHQDNQPAQLASVLGVVALAAIVVRKAHWLGDRGWMLIPVTLGLGTLAVVLGVAGLRRVNPDATPPVGRRAAAIAGCVAGALAVGTVVVKMISSFLAGPGGS